MFVLRDVSGETIWVVQQKIGKLAIPLHRELLAAFAAANRDHVTIINTAYGKPFTVDGFSQWMLAAITAAGLPLECQPHGLRKAAGRRLAEATNLSLALSRREAVPRVSVLFSLDVIRPGRCTKA